MEDLTGIGRSLPAFALLPLMLLSLGLVVWSQAGLRSGAARFVGWALFIRFAMGALHDFTFKSSPAGISYNALGSIAIFAAGLFVVRRRALFDVAVLPFIPLIAVFLVSGIVNGEASGMVTTLTKYAYLIVLIFAVTDGLRDVGPERVFRVVVGSLSLPVILQLASIVLGIAKPGETDGADSFIGGYHHEAAFSVILASLVLAACLVRELRLSVKLGIVFYGFVAIALANYRTAILAVAPLVGIALLTAIPRGFLRRQRGIVIGAMVMVVVAAGLGAASLGSERFADLTTVSESRGDLIKRPEDFTVADRQVMSGRTLIWSMYLYGWSDAPRTQQAIGYGAETWSKTFTLYAHNTLVNALYETGVFGFAATILLWLWMFGLAVLARAGPRLELIAAHLSFFLLNMATMPMWLIEGMIFYGLLCGYTVYWFGRSRALRRSRAGFAAPAGMTPALR